MTPDDRPSERSSVLAGGLAVGTSTAVRLVAGFAISIIVARALGAGPKGELALLQQVPAIAALLLGFGFEGAHAYFVGRHGTDAGAAVSDSLLLSVVAAAIGIPAATLVMDTWMPALADVTVGTMALAASAVPLLVLTNLLSGVLTGQGRIPRQALAQVASALLALGLIAGLSLLGRLSVTSLIAASLAGIAVGAAWSFAGTGTSRLKRPSLRRLRQQFTYARRNYVQSVAGYLEVRQDVLLLGALSTAAGVGVYTLGVAFAELLFYAPQALAPALTARALQEDAGVGADLTATVSRLLTAFTVVMAVSLAIVVRPLIALVFGTQFVSAGWVFLLLVPGIVAWAMSSQPTAYLTTHGRLFPRMSTIALVLNLVLNLVLIPRIGVYGAAVATTISYSVSAAYIVHTFLRVTQLGLADVVVVRRADVRLAIEAARALRHKVSSAR